MPGLASRAEEGTSIWGRHIQAPGKLASWRSRQRRAGPLAARLRSPDKLRVWPLMLQLSQLPAGFYPWLLPGKKNPSSFTKTWFEIFLLCSGRTTQITSDEERRKWN